MGGGEDEVLLAVDVGTFALGVTAPEHENEVLFVLGELLYDVVCEGFPALVSV